MKGTMSKEGGFMTTMLIRGYEWEQTNYHFQENR